jgi:predicted secreted protein
MQLGPFTLVAIYLTLWWTVLFVVLPLGARSHHEAGADLPAGHEPSSPLTLNLKRKAITTTWVSAIAWVLVVALAEYALRGWANR